MIWVIALLPFLGAIKIPSKEERESYKCLASPECVKTYLENENKLLGLKKQGGLPAGAPPIPGLGAPPISSNVSPTGNQPPIFKGPLAVNVMFGEKFEIQLDWTDETPESVTVSIPPEVKAGTVTRTGKFHYSAAHSQPLEMLSDLNRVVFILDDGEHTTEFTPTWNYCACRNGGLCNYDTKANFDSFYMASCICGDAWGGEFCTEDKDGCENPNPSCFPGVRCIDQAAPLSGHMCDDCPPGHSGNGFICEPDSDESREPICYDLPKIPHGSFIIPNSLVDFVDSGEQALAEGETLRYECEEGYEMMGSRDLICMSGGIFSEVPPICRDINECQRSPAPCHPTAQCRNSPGGYECECGRDWINVENTSACEPLVGFLKLDENNEDTASCTPSSANSVDVYWSITKRWQFDPEVIDKFIISWFPYETETEQADERFKLIGMDRGSITGGSMEYEDLMAETSLRKPDFEYIVLDHSYNAFIIDGLQPDTNYNIGVKLETKQGALIGEKIFCRAQTLPGIASPPQAAVVTEVLGTSFEVKFLPPAKPMGFIENYIVESKLITPEICQSPVAKEDECLPKYKIVSASSSEPSGQISAVIQGLNSEADYEYRIKALSKSTEGNWTAARKITTTRILPNELPAADDKIAAGCIEAELFVFDPENGELEWTDDFNDPASVQYMIWNDLLVGLVPNVHFIDGEDAVVATVEVKLAEFYEFNDQVVFRCKIHVYVDGNYQVNLATVAGQVYGNFEPYRSPDDSMTRIIPCDPCDGNDCSENARCIRKSTTFTCACDAGYKDIGRGNGLREGRLCEQLETGMPLAPRQPSTDDLMCHLTQADVFFLVDMSRTVSEEDLIKVITFIREFIKHYTVSPEDTQFGLAVFAAKYRVVFNLDDFEDKKTLLKSLLDLELKSLGKGTALGSAINEIIRTMNYAPNGRRPNHPLHVIIFADGKSADPVEEPASRLKKIAHSVKVVAIGNGVDRSEIGSIVHTPEDIVYLKNFNDIEKQTKQLEKSIAENLCPRDACPLFSQQDIIFLIDVSIKMEAQLDQVKKAIVDFVEQMNIATSGVRVGLVLFASTSSIAYDLDLQQLPKVIQKVLQSKVTIIPSDSQNLGQGLRTIVRIAENIQSAGFQELIMKFDGKGFPVGKDYTGIDTREISKRAKIIILSSGFVSDEAEMVLNIADLKESADIAVVSFNNNYDFSNVVDPKNIIEIDTESEEISQEIVKAFGRIKVDMLYGGCENEIISPRWVRVLSENEGEAEIIWEPLVGVDSFLLTKRNDFGQTETFPINNEDPSFTLSDLEAGSSYDISLTAIKNVDQEQVVRSRNVLPSRIFTKPTAPIMLDYESTEMSAALKVSDLVQNQADLLRVVLKKKNTSPFLDDFEVINVVEFPLEEVVANDFTLVFDQSNDIDLEPATTYVAEVTSVKGPMESDLKKFKFETRSLEAPVPQGVGISTVSNKEATITWEPSDAVRSYSLKIQDMDGEEVFEISDVPAEDLMMTEDGKPAFKVDDILEPGTAYKIIMQSTNEWKTSEPSDPTIFITEPEEVFSVEQSQQYMNKVRFTFYPPEEGSAENFVVKLYDDKDEAIREEINQRIVPFKDGQSQYVVTFETSEDTPIEPGAEYYVEVISQAGESRSAPVGRQLLTDIDAPALVNIVEVTNDTIKLEWEDVPDADEYRAMVYESMGSDFRVIDSNRKTVSFKINQGRIVGLQPGTGYTILVQGSRKGNAGKSKAVRAWTKPNPVNPDSIVSSTRVDSDANHQIDIFFDPPSIGGHDSFDLILRDPDGNWQEERKVQKPDVEFIGKYSANFVDLKPSTTYLLDIITYRGDEKSLTKDVEIISAHAIPPTNLRVKRVTPTSAVITFDPSPDADEFYYEVYQLVDSNDRQKQLRKRETVDKSVREIVVENLVPGSPHGMTMSSIANGVYGKRSKELNFFTQPAVVENLQVKFGTTELQVSFEPPSDGGVDYYDIIVEPSNEPGRIVDVKQIRAGEWLVWTSQTQLLLPGQDYTVTVSSFAGADGENKISKSGKMKPPPKPTLLKNFVDDRNNLRLVWEVTDQKLAPLVTYDVKIEEAGREDAAPALEIDNIRQTTITRPEFDSTRLYIAKVRSKLRKIYSEWEEKEIQISSSLVPTVPTSPGEQPSVIDVSELSDSLVDPLPSFICENSTKEVDMIFLLDSSGSVGKPNFQVMKSWMRRLISGLNIAPGRTQVSVYLYNNIFRTIFDLNEHQNAYDMITAINKMVYSGKGTRIARALQNAMSKVLIPESGLRPNSEIYLYLITDGKESDVADVNNMANDIKDAFGERITLTAVGISRSVENAELYAIASMPKKDNVFLLENYRDLDTITKVANYHAGCIPRSAVYTDVEPDSFDIEIGENLPDATNKPYPPIPKQLRVSEKMTPTGKKATLTAEFAKSRTKKAATEVVLEQVRTSTKEIVEIYFREEKGDSSTFDDLPLGFEYHCKVRSKHKVSREMVYSEWRYFNNFVSLSPPSVETDDIEVLEGSTTFTAAFPIDGHVDFFMVEAIRQPESRGQKAIVKKVETTDPENIDEQGRYLIKFNAEDGISSSSTYKIRVDSFAGNQKTEKPTEFIIQTTDITARVMLTKIEENTITARVTASEGIRIENNHKTI